MTNVGNQNTNEAGKNVKCNKCGMQHYGNCPIKCNKCGKIRHKARDCWSKEMHVPLKKRTLVVKGDDCVSRLKVVSCMKVKKYVDRGTAPVARAPYRLTPSEMKELAKRL
nr:putative reverse transcriptase domain-containing protein [Tanacetum cinerariifolium]